MALATLTSRVDESDKAAFDDFCSSVGLTTSAAINMYVKVVVRERKIPFEVKQVDSSRAATNHTDTVEHASTETVLALSGKMMDRYDEAFKELAK